MASCYLPTSNFWCNPLGGEKRKRPRKFTEHHFESERQQGKGLHSSVGNAGLTIRKCQRLNGSDDFVEMELEAIVP